MEINKINYAAETRSFDEHNDVTEAININKTSKFSRLIKAIIISTAAIVTSCTNDNTGESFNTQQNTASDWVKNTIPNINSLETALSSIVDFIDKDYNNENLYKLFEDDEGLQDFDLIITIYGSLDDNQKKTIDNLIKKYVLQVIQENYGDSTNININDLIVTLNKSKNHFEVIQKDNNSAIIFFATVTHDFYIEEEKQEESMNNEKLEI